MVNPGSIEGNGDIKIRGTIGGSQGTFSGKFSADAINAVESIHIRDGAVSAYYGFGRPPMVNGEFTDFTFTLPAQSMDAVYVLHGMMIVMPSFWIVFPQETNFPIYVNIRPSWIRIYRDNVLWINQTDHSVTPSIFKLPLSLGLADFVPSSRSRTYRIVTGSNQGPNPGNPVYEAKGSFYFKTPLVVEFRKR